MIFLFAISNLEDETITLCQKGNFSVKLLRTPAEQITLGRVSLMNPIVSMDETYEKIQQSVGILRRVGYEMNLGTE
jgi:hypothetical protein